MRADAFTLLRNHRPLETVYEIDRYIIGSGSFARVIRGRHRATNVPVAIRITSWDQTDELVSHTCDDGKARQVVKALVDEIDAHRLLKGSEHILTPCEHHWIGDNVCVDISRLATTDLIRRMYDREQAIGPALLRSWTRDLVHAVAECHRAGVLHRDIKPSNILVFESGLRMIDFNAARRVSDLEECDRPYTTIYYRPPEMLLGATHDSPFVDMWSMGCVLAGLILRKPIFPGLHEVQVMLMIFQLLGTPGYVTSQGQVLHPLATKLPYFSPLYPQWPASSLKQRLGDEVHPDLLDLISRLLQVDPTRRLTAEGALKHPFVRDQ